MSVKPTWSHGGPSVQNSTAVPGTSISSGRAIYIVPAIQNPALNAFFVGTTVTFLLEGNGGLIDQTTGQPPSSEWLDYSGGGYTLTTGQSISKFLPACIPFWRTRITAITLGGGSGLVSYVPSIVTYTGTVTAQYGPFVFPQSTS